MNVSSEIERGLARILSKVEQALGRVFIYTRTANSTSLGDGDAVETSDLGADPGKQTKGQRPAVRITPFGFNSRQPKGLRGLTLRLGSSNAFFIGIGPQQAYGRGDLAVGETLIYNGPGCQVYLDQNGNVIITPTGSGTVQIAGNSHPLPKWDTFESALKGALATIVASNGGGNVLSDGGTTMTAFTTALANHTYESTKATNG